MTVVTLSELSELGDGEALPADQKGWLRSALRSRKVQIGLVILGIFIFAAVAGPSLVGNPSTTSVIGLTGPSSAHWLGTTNEGQDVFAELVNSARVSLIVGVLAAVISMTMSVVVGISGAFLGGLWDDVLSMLTNVFLVLPALPLVIVIASYFKDASTLLIALVISLTAWAWSARVIRAQTLSLRSRDFVQSARAAGEPVRRIVFFEILPNEIPLIAAQFLGTMIFAVLTQAGLAFLGIGSANTWSWGTMMYWAENAGALQLAAWWWFVPPGFCLAMLGAGLALLNFGIDEFGHNRPVRRRRWRRSSLSLRTQSNGLVRPPGDTVLDVKDLSVVYDTGSNALRAVNDVSLRLGVGTTVGIAGESGSGKSTLAHAIATLTRPPAEIVSGSVDYFPASTDSKSANAIDVVRLQGEELRKFRWEEIAVVFQSALNALNPVLSIRAQLTDTIRAHRPGVNKREAGVWAGKLLDEVGVTRDRLDAFPHQLSGGMRQRVMIAMALALQPQILIMDEPTTALDVVTQRQILKRIAELQTELNFAMVFITHDLSLLLEIADVIAVMYAGELVEVGRTQAIYKVPAHPYTAGLLESSPPLRGPRRTLTGIPGLPPDLHRAIAGCPFASRCSRRMDRCDVERPTLVRLQPEDPRYGEQSVACWLHADAGPATSPEAVAPSPAEGTTAGAEGEGGT